VERKVEWLGRVLHANGTNARLSLSWRFITRTTADPSFNAATIMASKISFGHASAGFQAGIVNGLVSTTFYLPPGQLLNGASTEVPCVMSRPAC
jgi:hypothetical protein